MLLQGLLYCLTILPLGILAALDDKSKLMNRTIDRVSDIMLVYGAQKDMGVNGWCRDGHQPVTCERRAELPSRTRRMCHSIGVI